MNKRTPPLFLIVLFIVVLSAISCNEDYVPPTALLATISGKITESATGDPLINVKVTTSPASQTVYSDVHGMFYLNGVEEGTYTLICTREGYTTTTSSIQIDRGAVLTKNFILSEAVSSNRILKLDTRNYWVYSTGACAIDSVRNENSIDFYWSSCWTFGYTHGYLVGRLGDGTYYKVMPKIPVVGDAWKQVDDDPEYIRIIAKDTITVPAGTFICFVVHRDGSSALPQYWAMNVGLIKGPEGELQSYSVHNRSFTQSR